MRDDAVDQGALRGEVDVEQRAALGLEVKVPGDEVALADGGDGGAADLRGAGRVGGVGGASAVVGGLVVGRGGRGSSGVFVVFFSVSGVPPPGDELRALLDIDETQIDTMLRLICLPENGCVEWWKQYGYASWLGDGRGLTASLYGLCSGTGDMLMCFRELQKIDPQNPLAKYVPALSKAHGESRHGIEDLADKIHAAKNDPAWRRAVWKVYIDLYWSFVAEFCKKEGSCKHRPGPVLETALSKYEMIDSALNHGADMDSFDTILHKMDKTARDSTDEATWLEAWCKARRTILRTDRKNDFDTSHTGDRCKIPLKLLKEKNFDLKRPFVAANGYWGSNMKIE